jgi:hypothetical protein
LAPTLAAINSATVVAMPLTVAVGVTMQLHCLHTAHTPHAERLVLNASNTLLLIRAPHSAP